jgi:hypothetical protein
MVSEHGAGHRLGDGRRGDGGEDAPPASPRSQVGDDGAEDAVHGGGDLGDPVLVEHDLRVAIDAAGERPLAGGRRRDAGRGGRPRGGEADLEPLAGAERRQVGVADAALRFRHVVLHAEELFDGRMPAGSSFGALVTMGRRERLRPGVGGRRAPGQDLGTAVEALVLVEAVLLAVEPRRVAQLGVA